MTAVRSPDAERMARNRAAKRDIPVREIGDRDRRALCEEDDERWLRTYIPKVFGFPFTRDQQRIIEITGQALRYGLTKCVAAARGDGKTSIARYLTLKYTLPRLDSPPLVPCALLINATGTKAVKSLKAIKSKLATPGGPLWEDYPLECDVCWYVSKSAKRASAATAGGIPLFVEWGQEHIILPSFEGQEYSGILASMGITSNEIQGFNLYDVRPRFVLLDDLDDRDSLASASGGTIAQKIETAIDENIAGLRGPGQSLGVVMLCTIPSRRSVAFLYSSPQEKPDWSGVRFRRIIQWPGEEAMKLWDKYIRLKHQGQQEFDEKGKPIDELGRNAHQFYLDNREAMDDDGTTELNNPYDFDATELPDGSQKQISALQNCFDYIAKNGMDSFQTEYQNDPPEDNIKTAGLTAAMVAGRMSGLERNELPLADVQIVCGIDIGKWLCHWVKVAIHGNAIGHVIDYGRLETFDVETNTPPAAVEKQLLAALTRWRVDVLAQHPPGFTLVDSGDYSAAIYEFVRRAGTGFGASKGQPATRFAWTGESTDNRRYFDNCRADKHESEGVWLYNVNSHHWKHEVHKRFVTPTFDSAYQYMDGSLSVFSARDARGDPDTSVHTRFSNHIVAEEMQETFVEEKGLIRKWVEKSKNNHYLDALALALCAAGVLGVRVVPRVMQEPPPRPVHVPTKNSRFLTRPGGWVPRR